MPSLDQGRIGMRVGGLTVVVVLLGMIGGLCMGSFAVVQTAWSDDGLTPDAMLQLLASAVKLPLLFFLTLLVTLPSLYVFNAFVGSRLSLVSVYRLLIAMLGVMLAVFASLGPIVVFFGLSTTSYPFMKLLNVAMAAVSGFLGLAFLMRTLHRLVMVQEQAMLEQMIAEREPGDEPEAATGGAAGQDDEPADEQDLSAKPHSALDRIGPTPAKARAVFRIWLFVFALVGAQMSWVLRPFIGHPDLPFAWLRGRQSNFFMDVIQSIGELFTA